MTRIMIVDDDFLVRANLRLLLENLAQGDETLSCQLVAEAADGEEAIRLLSAAEPDVIISDIRMPHLDGIQLQKYLLEHKPNIRMIMLSSYDDFDYVREALKNGAVDYVLKHKLTKEVLTEAVARAGKQAARKPDQELDRVDSVIALKREFVMKLISGFYRQPEEVVARIRILDLQLGVKNITAVLMRVQNLNASTIGAYHLEYSILNIVDEILHDAGGGVCCHISDEKYALLFSFEAIHSQRTRDERFAAVCGRISTCLMKYLNITANFYAGAVVPGILETEKSYLSAEQKYNNRYYDSQAIGHAAQARPFDILAIFDAEREKKLIADIRNNRFDRAIQTLGEVFEELKKWRPTSSELQIVFIDLLGALNRACKERSVDINKLYKGELPQNHFNEFNSIESAKKWYMELFPKAFQQSGFQSGTPSSDYVAAAVSYIHRHYAEDIPQTAVADMIGISPAYLSKLFKDNLGIGFVEFLSNYRLDKAKELLEQRELSNKDVSGMCGFNDDTYFSKAFKKYTGLTPKAYKKKVGNE